MPLPVSLIRKALGQALEGRSSAKLANDLRFPGGERVPTTHGGEVLGDFTVNRRPGKSPREGFKEGMDELGVDFQIKQNEALRETDPGEYDDLPSFGDYLKEPSAYDQPMKPPTVGKYGRAQSRSMHPEDLEVEFVEQAREAKRLVDMGFFDDSDVARILQNGFNESDYQKLKAARLEMRGMEEDDVFWNAKQTGDYSKWEELKRMRGEDDIPY